MVIGMKRVGNIFSKVIEYENLLLAYYKARKGKKKKKEVLRFSYNLEKNLIDLKEELDNKTYKPGKYRVFRVLFPKERVIKALPFRDRVVQHALCNYIEPIFNKRMIFHSYACREKKGTYRAVEAVYQWLFKIGDCYVYKGDVHKFFDSIDHEVLKKLIRRVIKCEDTLWLIELIIDWNGSDIPIGLPVGNLTSQLFANVYLNELDIYVKHVLKVKPYFRYMDDFLLLDLFKDNLREWEDKIINFLKEELKLDINPKSGISHSKNGVDFVGYRIWYDHKKLRKRSISSIKRAIKGYREGKVTKATFRSQCRSWEGHAIKADTYNLRKKILVDIKEALKFRNGE